MTKDQLQAELDATTANYRRKGLRLAGYRTLDNAIDYIMSQYVDGDVTLAHYAECLGLIAVAKYKVLYSRVTV